MKKVLSLVFCVVAMIACLSLIAPEISNNTTVTAVAATDTAKNPLETRFLNMLNHNFVYNSDFDNTDTIINNASLALLDLRDAANSDYIADTYVKGFVKDMYGIDIIDMSGINADYPQLEGFLYIVPRGFTSYNHTIVSIVENEDGSYKVISNVIEDSHDGIAKSKKAVSLFVKNDASAFGYNMIYCNIIENSTDI